MYQLTLKKVRHIHNQKLTEYLLMKLHEVQIKDKTQSPPQVRTLRENPLHLKPSLPKYTYWCQVYQNKTILLSTPWVPQANCLYSTLIMSGRGKKNPLLGLYLKANSKKRVCGLNSLYLASPKIPSQEFSLKRSQDCNDHRLLAQVSANSLCRNPPSTQSQRLPKGQILIYVLTVTITKHTRKTAIMRKSQQKQQVVDLDPQRKTSNT